MPLTEGQLLQRVLLPNFDAVPQKTVLDRVLRAGAWRTDAELRTALAAISFVPRGVDLSQQCTMQWLYPALGHTVLSFSAGSALT